LKAYCPKCDYELELPNGGTASNYLCPNCVLPLVEEAEAKAKAKVKVKAKAKEEEEEKGSRKRREEVIE